MWVREADTNVVVNTRVSGRWGKDLRVKVIGVYHHKGDWGERRTVLDIYDAGPKKVWLSLWYSPSLVALEADCLACALRYRRRLRD